MVARGQNIINLIADVMNPARRVLFEKSLDRAVVAQRIEQFNLGVRQFDEHDRHAMIWLILGRVHFCTQRAAILRRGGLQIGHGNGNMVQASDHALGSLSGGVAGGYGQGAALGQEARRSQGRKTRRGRL